MPRPDSKVPHSLPGGQGHFRKNISGALAILCSLGHDVIAAPLRNLNNMGKFCYIIKTPWVKQSFDKFK